MKTVKDFGAVGDGITDDTVSIQNALNNATNLYFPAGNYKITSTLVSNNRTLVISGDGNASRIQSYAPLGAFKFTGTMGRDGHEFHASKIMFQSMVDSDFAITAIFSTVNSWWSAGRTPHRSIIFDGVSVTGTGACGTTAATTNFKKGFVFRNAGNAFIENCVLDACLTPGSVGIDYSSAQWEHTTEFFINNCVVDKFETGVKFSEFSEGLYLNNCTLLSCVTGLEATSNFPGAPGVFVRGCHINSRMWGMRFSQVTQVIITDNLIYNMFGSGAPAPYIGIHTGELTAAFPMDFMIRGNQFYKVDDQCGESYGIIIAGSSAQETMLIDSNRFTGYKFGVLVQPNANKVYCTPQNFYNGCMFNVYNQQTGRVSDYLIN